MPRSFKESQGMTRNLGNIKKLQGIFSTLSIGNSRNLEEHSKLLEKIGATVTTIIMWFEACILINHCYTSNSVIWFAGIPETSGRDQLVQQMNAWNTFLRDAVALNLLLFDY